MDQDRVTWDRRWTDQMVLYRAQRDDALAGAAEVASLVRRAQAGDDGAMSSLRDVVYQRMLEGGNEADASRSALSEAPRRSSSRVYASLAAFGCLGWFLVPMLLVFALVSAVDGREAANMLGAVLGWLLIFTAPVGVIAGIVAGRWTLKGESVSRRYVLSFAMLLALFLGISVVIASPAVFRSDPEEQAAELEALRTSEPMVLVFDAGGVLQRRWGSYGEGHGQFRAAEGIATDASGDVLVSTRSNVLRFNSRGTWLETLPVGGTGLAVNDTGVVFVASHGNLVYAIGPESERQIDSRLSSIEGIAVDRSGSVYVIGRDNSRPSEKIMRKITARGKGTQFAVWGSYGTGDDQFQGPNGIAVDGEGNVYVTDSGNHRVQVFTPDGTLLTQWGNRSGGFAIAVDGTGTVYIGDSGNHQILRFSTTGTFLGQWPLKGSEKDIVLSANGIAVDQLGTVYVVRGLTPTKVR